MFERNIDNYSIREQLQLYKSTVAICGIGGGGCVVAEILARTGVGHLILADGDRFEDSNKNRQIGATDLSIGKYKAEIIANRIRSINSKCHIMYFNEYVTKENYRNILSKVDIICDTVDGNKNKRDILTYALELQIPIASGGLSGSSFDYFIIDDFSLSVDQIRPKTNIKSLSANTSSLFIQGGYQAQAIIDYLLCRPIKTNTIYRYNAYKLLFEEYAI